MICCMLGEPDDPLLKGRELYFIYHWSPDGKLLRDLEWMLVASASILRRTDYKGSAARPETPDRWSRSKTFEAAAWMYPFHPGEVVPLPSRPFSGRRRSAGRDQICSPDGGRGIKIVP